MSTRQEGAPAPPITSRDDLIQWFAVGSKPKSEWRIGTEHEKIVFRTDDLRPVPYEGPRGIRAIMAELIARSGWLPIGFVEHGPAGMAFLKPLALFGLDGLDDITHGLFWSMLLNAGSYVAVSLATRPSPGSSATGR